MAKLIILNKPFQVLSQFTDNEGRPTLADYITTKGVYPAGRLDYDSEGMMLLTDNGQLQSQISHPRNKLNKTYWVQVEGICKDTHCRALLDGVELKDGSARAIDCETMSPPDIWPRTPPIRERKTVPDSWIKITINEGRNRQIRRMTAAVGLPTLRLIRFAIGEMTISDLKPGEFKLHQANSYKSLVKNLLTKENN